MRRSMDIRMFLAYFAIGGAVVAAVTYFGGHAKSQLAAFIAFLPAISTITLCTIYYNGGTERAVSYAKSLLIYVPPWLLFVIGVIFLLPRIGLVGSLIVSIAVYIGAAFLVLRLTT